MQRMVRSGIVAIPNIAFGYYVGDAILDCVGEKRLTKAFPFQTLLKNGVIIAGGSDSPGYWPVDPLRDIATAALAQDALGRSLDTGGENHHRRSLRHAHHNGVLGRLRRKR